MPDTETKTSMTTLPGPFAQAMLARPDFMTANGAPTHSTSGEELVDLFFHTCRGMDSDRLYELMNKAAKSSVEDMVRIVLHLRDCRGGKGERKLFRYALGYLLDHHPDLVARLAPHLPQFGRFDDLVGLRDPADLLLQTLAQQLRQDWKAYTAHQKVKATTPSTPAPLKISLASKWAPSEGKHHDTNGTVLRLAKVLVNEGNKKALQGRKLLREYRRRIRLLRQCLSLVETKACADRWGEIEYSKVPSRAMHMYGKKAFAAHDEARFEDYQRQLEEGRADIKHAGVYPHELVARYFYAGHADPVVEAQWAKIVEEVRGYGVLEKWLVLSDVSGSMSGTPMNVSIALGLLISLLVNDPFRNLVLTFESEPRFHHVQGQTLYERVHSLKHARWGGTTNLAGAFDCILAKASAAELKPEDMPTTLVVISDMQFDVADSGFKTNYQNVLQKYAQAGYPVPRLVFWNVNGSIRDTPVTASMHQTALVSGFSPSILKTLLQGKVHTPYEVMRAAIDDPRYDVLSSP